jgi:DNA repair protein RadC
VRDGASAIVLIHNHPSGDPNPSEEDLRMTEALAVACEVVGLELLDHVIVARGGAASLRELGAVEAIEEGEAGERQETRKTRETDQTHRRARKRR